MSYTAVSIIGFFAGLCTTAAFIPQVLKVWRTRSAQDISLGMYTIFVTGVALWLAYGVMAGSMPIIIANALTLILALAILVMKLRFG
jgi:MtN3 and saliva related transmembrane protein